MRKITKLFLALLLIAPVTPGLSALPAKQYEQFCTICHLPGAHGAPKVGDRDAWTERLRSGLNPVYRNAIIGIPNSTMLPKGGHTRLSETEVRAIVDFMITATALPASVIREAKRYDQLGLSDPDFIRRDTSRDGFLSRQEVSADPVLLESFSRFDSNKDGLLAETEYRNAELVLERERIGKTVDDSELGVAVGKALTAVKGLNAKNIRTEVSAGVLTISGSVDHASLAIQIMDNVKRIPGLKSIQNRLVTGDQLGWD